METDNTVSIWIGNFNSKNDLEDYFDLKYDDEGEVNPSAFYNEYKIDIDDIDDYLIEKEVFDVRHTDLFNMLNGASYENNIISNLKALFIEGTIPSSNTIILIYNYSYLGDIRFTSNSQFFGTVIYK
ncbi:immunity 22 family protein [Streptococcus plurextorum]|uniref:immunity 22 family protein n=1 Tax=Streptococcus plurextorum TaxID=456876 RepID=UPI0004132DCA|nr:immunity 22 family protein [Streptococcus plurextorum]